MYYNTILFTHDDLDGAGCRIVFEIAHKHLTKGEEYTVINCSNGNINDKVLAAIDEGHIGPDTIICFADISPSAEVACLLIDKYGADHIYVWDHHPTALYIVTLLPNATVKSENDMGIMESGTSLMFQYYNSIAFSNPMDPRSKYFHEGNLSLFSKFVDAVRSYDTYEWKKTNNISAKKLNMYMYMLGMDYFCNKYIEEITSGTATDIIIGSDDVKVILETKLQNEKNIINAITPEDIYTLNINGFTIAFTFPIFGANVSEFGNTFLAKYPQYDFFASISFGNKESTLQFRSCKDDLNLGLYIAAPLGGGGHPKAAGCPVPENITTSIMDMVVNFLSNIESKSDIMNKLPSLELEK